MRMNFGLPLTALLLAALAGGAASSGRSVTPTPKPGAVASTSTKPTLTPAKAGTSSTARKPVAAPADSLGPGSTELAGFSFLAGRWQGELRSYPILMDISIDGASITPGHPMRFAIRVVPEPGTMGLGVDGDYSSFVTWSSSARALRAVIADKAGRGVELLGGKTPGANEWLFNSTDGGAPFPFQVRVKPVSPNQVLVAYSSGGRLPLKYEITFNRVTG